MMLFISSFLIVFNSFFGSNTVQSEKSSFKVLTTPNNDTFTLSKFKGKVVILNFWASWSKSSRVENKNLVRIYQKYKLSSKVAFVSISLDTDETSWRSAIDEDGLEWKNQYCDFKKYDSPMAKAYQVNTLPQMFLFDKTGKMLRSASKVQEIETAIEELLN